MVGTATNRELTAIVSFARELVGTANRPAPDDLGVTRDSVELRPEDHHELPVPLIFSLSPKKSESISDSGIWFLNDGE
jgi:hypothetical protein